MSDFRTPCDNCLLKQKCSAEKLACSSYRYYITSGRVRFPSNPSRAIYESLNNEQPGGLAPVFQEQLDIPDDVAKVFDSVVKSGCPFTRGQLIRKIEGMVGEPALAFVSKLLKKARRRGTIVRKEKYGIWIGAG